MLELLERKRKAPGRINQKTKQWEWDTVEWTYDDEQGLYRSNREIPQGFWKEKKWRKKGNHRRNIAGFILFSIDNLRGPGGSLKAFGCEKGTSLTCRIKGGDDLWPA